jgi:sterol desaturase/sphingolipid hydroxylase (fatty acid hydroxylase superfamily)
LNLLLELEAQLRLVSFLSLLVVFATLEGLRPAKFYVEPRKLRWINNLIIVGLDTLALRLLLPLLAVEAALIAETHQIGLLHVMPEGPPLLIGVVSFLVLDLAIYFQHRVFHHVPWLWRLHRMHHSDVVIDVSTALRFHPLEILLSMLIKISLVTALGLSPFVVIAFEVTLNASSLLNHANWNMGKWDRWVRCILVTPDMHRIHHSSRVEETNSNYGFCLSLWDRLLGTYTPQSRLRIADMTIGLESFRRPQDQTLWALIKNPFLTDPKDS